MCIGLAYIRVQIMRYSHRTDGPNQPVTSPVFHKQCAVDDGRQVDRNGSQIACHLPWNGWRWQQVVNGEGCLWMIYSIKLLQLLSLIREPFSLGFFFFYTQEDEQFFPSLPGAFVNGYQSVNQSVFVVPSSNTDCKQFFHNRQFFEYSFSTNIFYLLVSTKKMLEISHKNKLF